MIMRFYWRKKKDKACWLISSVAFVNGRCPSKIWEVTLISSQLGLGGLSVEAVLVDEPYIKHPASKIAAATDLIGSINIQTRRTVDGNLYIPFEINPRLSSTHLFRKRFGFDDLVWWLNVLNGKGYYYEKQYK